MDSFDLIIVGGGISGLSLAHAARRQGRRVCVLEREERVGGAIHSVAHGQDFWMELGAHTAYNSYGHFLALAEELGLAEGRTERATSAWNLWDGGAPVKVTSRLRWGQIALRLPLLLTSKRAGQTVEGYFGRVVGPRNFREVVGPMLGAVVSQDAGGFPADLLFKKRPRRKDWPRSFTLAGGLGTLTRAIAEHGGGSGGLAVRTGQAGAVETLSRAGAAWRVGTGDGAACEAPWLALATPPDTAGFLLRDAAPEVSRALRDFGVAEISTVGVAVRKDKVRLPEMAGLVGLGAPFRSVVTRDTVPHEGLRGFAFHFRPEASEDEQAAQIEAVLGCGPEAWELRATAWRRLPSMAMGHAERIAGLDALLADQPLLLTGNWFGGMAIEDCMTRSAGQAERLPV